MLLHPHLEPKIQGEGKDRTRFRFFTSEVASQAWKAANLALFASDTENNDGYCLLTCTVLHIETGVKILTLKKALV